MSVPAFFGHHPRLAGKTREPREMLPNFLVIGAMKAGTTWLCDFMRQHPDVFIPERKELFFFGGPEKNAEDLANYERWFEGARPGQRIGEGTVHYLPSPDAPSQVVRALGDDLRIIVCLRSPATRTYSHYLHRYRDLMETRRFEDCLGVDEQLRPTERSTKRPNVYLHYSAYDQNVAAWLELIPKERFLFLVMEEDFRDVTSLGETLSDFLALPRLEWHPIERQNVARLPEVRVIDEPLRVELDGGAAPPLRVPEGSLEVREARVVRYRTSLSFLSKGVIRHYSNLRDDVGLVEYGQAWIGNRPRSYKLGESAEKKINNGLFKQNIDRLAELISRDLSFWL